MNPNKFASAFANTKNWLLLAFLLTAWAAPAVGSAQEKQKNPITPKFLIGEAVSLSNKSYPEVEKAIQRFSNRDAAGALTFLETAKKKYPKLPPADIMMAKMNLLIRNGRAVQFLLERVVVLHPDDPEAFLMLADLAFQGQRTAESLALFDTAAPLVEKFTENEKRKRNFQIQLLAGRAAVAERRQQWEPAEGFLQQWLKLDPDNDVARSRMGMMLFRLDRKTESSAEFAKARAINPNRSHPDIAMGQLYSASGENENARKSYDKAYNENSSDTQVAQSYAEWLIQQGELKNAQKVASKLRQQTPDSVAALVLDGVLAYMQQQPARAEQTLQKVLSLDPRNARATDMMALLLIQSEKVEDKERALTYAQNNAGWLPNNPQANVTRAYVLYELGRKKEAQKSVSQISNVQPQPDSMYLIAKMLVAEGQKDRAIVYLKQVASQKGGMIIFRREAEALLNKLQASGSESK